VRHWKKAVMTEIGAPLVGFYDYRLVALSIFIAISASYMALDLGGRVTAARGWMRSAWLAGGAAAMGLGIWSMHFTGMLAFNLPVPVFYDWPTVLLSLLAAILSSAVALYVVSRKKMGRAQALTGSIFMGFGIAGMHYIGTAAMRLSAVCHYSPPIVVLSALIAGVASLVAVVFTFDFREDFRGTTLAKIISAAVMGAAIFLMHYTGMWSASFLPTTVLPDISHAVSISSLGLAGIVIGTLLVQGLAIVTSSVDRRFAREAQELQTSERFRQIAENLQVALALTNGDFSELLYVNRTYEEIWGRTLESFYAKPMSFLEGIHPEDRGRAAERVQRLIGGEPIDNLECRVVRPDGSISWVTCRGYPIRDAQGNVYRLVGSAVDITMRKRAEGALREYEKALEGLEEMVVVVDQEYRILLVNRAYMNYRGMGREQLVGRLASEVLDQKLFEDAIKKKMDECFQGKVIKYELKYQYPHLGERDLSLSYFPIEGSSGVDRVACVLQDVTERKRAEKTIRGEQDKAQRYLDIADVILLALDLDRRITLINRKGCSTLGRKEHELLGRDWVETCLPARVRDKLRASFHRLVGGDLSYIENPILTKSGEERMIGWHNTVVRDGEGRVTGTLSSGEDITERKRAEEDLKQLSGQLLHLQDEERRKIAQDLHDSTGQNLVALATMLGQVRSSAPSDERKSRTAISECLGLAEQCIREIRTLSYALYPSELHESGLQDAIRDYVNGFTQRSGIQVELEISPSVGQMERNIELALFRVVQESLTNIQRHSGSHQAKIRIDRNSDLTLEVSDFGHGVHASDQGGKEEPQFKVGVGILSMQERVKLVGGRLDIDSTSHGTTVRVTVPLGEEKREEAAHSDR
jgi:PAS domain S-box-containing protein